MNWGMNMAFSKTDSGRVWFLDLDGTIFVHNKYLSLEKDELDELLPGALEFFSRVNNNDKIIIVSSRSDNFKEITIRSLKHYDIRYDYLLFNMPKGPRILINDRKPDGTKTSYALNLTRNSPLNVPEKYFEI